MKVPFVLVIMYINSKRGTTKKVNIVSYTLYKPASR